MKKTFSYMRFNPNYWHLRVAMKDSDIRLILLQGGSSSSKTLSVVQAIVIDTMTNNTNTLVLRKVSASISDTIYNDFKTEIARFKFDNMFEFVLNTIRFKGGAVIRFKGLDDSEKIKGLSSFKRVVMDELSEFDEEDFDQIGLRLRGIEGQQIIATFNPISELHWIKKKLFDAETLVEQPVYIDGVRAYNSQGGKITTRFNLGRDYTSVAKKWMNSPKAIWDTRINDYSMHKPDMVILKSTYLNNFWVVGSPDGKYGYYDEQTIATFEKHKLNNYNYYKVYALGEWGTIKTGGEFLPAFSLDKHIKRSPYNPELPIHVSIDNNVLPYITSTFYQVDGKKVSQINEICAAEPNNTVTKAASLAVDYLHSINHHDVVFLYADASTKARNTIDENALTFFDKYKAEIETSFQVSERVQTNNPSVSLTGEFFNEILLGTQDITFQVDDSCVNSISDYSNAKKDENGGMLKQRVKNKETGQTYEKYGHVCDSTRYFLYSCFQREFIQFSNRRNRNKIKEGDMKFYKVLPDGIDMIFIIPAVNEMFVYAVCRLVGKELFISDAYLSSITPNLSDVAIKIKPDYIQVDGKPDYLFSLRESLCDIDTQIIGKKLPAKLDDRIPALINYINGIKYKHDYDTSDEYNAFVQSLLDYKKGGGLEAISVLCSMVEYNLKAGNI